MDLNDYKPNSHASKEKRQAAEPKKKLTKVVSGPVVTKKKNFLETVFSPENLKSIGSYVANDLLIPSGKKLLSEIIRSASDLLIFGNTRGGGYRDTPISSKVAYRQYYDRREPERRDPYKPRATYGYDDIVISSRGEAEQVLSTLSDALEEYGAVTVGDFYDSVGESCDYTAYNYGWDNLGGARVVPTRGGYMLDLPPVKPIR